MAVGTLSAYYRPTDYLGTIRDEAETLMIPNTWDEMGLQGQAKLEGLTLTAQVVNGLDSTAFSSQHGWRSDTTPLRASARHGSGRGPRAESPASRAFRRLGLLRRQLAQPSQAGPGEGVRDANDPEVAPCGYVSAPLLLLDPHLSVERAPGAPRRW